MSGALLELMKPEMEAYEREYVKKHMKEIAKNCLKQNVAIEIVEKCIPELSPEEIQAIAKSLEERP